MAEEKKAKHVTAQKEKPKAKTEEKHAKAKAAKAGKKDAKIEAKPEVAHAKKPEVKHAKPAKAEKPAEKGKAVAVKKEKDDSKGKEKPAKKPYVKKKPVKVSKSKEVKKLSALVRAKKRHMFRGRFGKRSVRKVSKEKWQKWRKPRGIDIVFKKEDGLVPGTGYRTPKKIRFVHPSGYEERLVRNMNELLAVEKEKARVAARISRTIGKKKKTEMLKKADELKIAVLNR